MLRRVGIYSAAVTRVSAFSQGSCRCFSAGKGDVNSWSMIVTGGIGDLSFFRSLLCSDHTFVFCFCLCSPGWPGFDHGTSPQTSASIYHRQIFHLLLITISLHVLPVVDSPCQCSLYVLGKLYNDSSFR